jgi:hypothetical protein
MRSKYDERGMKPPIDAEAAAANFLRSLRGYRE